MEEQLVLTDENLVVIPKKNHIDPSTSSGTSPTPKPLSADSLRRLADALEEAFTAPSASAKVGA